MKVCAIVGAGDFFPERFEKEKYGFIIAADGGWRTLLNIGVTPDLVVGDFDSSTAPIEFECVRHKVEKDETDMHLAYLEGAQRGYDTFYVFGGVGGREDHTFANYCLLYYAKQEKNQMYLMARDSYSFVIENEDITLAADSGKTFSIFAFGSDARRVSIRGAKYNTDNVTLKCSFPLGVSNSFTDSTVTVTVGDGALLIMSEY